METLEEIRVEVVGINRTEIQIRTSLGGVAYHFRKGAPVDEIVGNLYRMAAQLQIDAAYRAAIKPSGEPRP